MLCDYSCAVINPYNSLKVNRCALFNYNRHSHRRLSQPVCTRNELPLEAAWGELMKVEQTGRNNAVPDSPQTPLLPLPFSLQHVDLGHVKGRSLVCEPPACRRAAPVTSILYGEAKALLNRALPRNPDVVWSGSDETRTIMIKRKKEKHTPAAGQGCHSALRVTADVLARLKYIYRQLSTIVTAGAQMEKKKLKGSYWKLPPIWRQPVVQNAVGAKFKSRLPRNASPSNGNCLQRRVRLNRNLCKQLLFISWADCEHCLWQLFFFVGHM